MQRGSTATRGAMASRRAAQPPTKNPAATAPKKAPVTTNAARAYQKPAVSYGTSDDDDSDYSSTDTDNSEEYRPLAFGFIKGGAVRKTGAPQQSNYSMKISQNAMNDSGLSLSDDEVPLTVTYENGAAKRKCGRVDDAVPTAKTMYGGVSDESSESECLPVRYTTGKRPRQMGRAVNANGPEATTEEAEVESVDPEDEMPLNTKLILNLVRRVRMNPQDIPLEAFAYVNWGDENYQEELKPLRRLYEELEAKARYVEKVKAAPQSTKKVDYDARIKEAVMALPQESAIVAKSNKITSRQLRAQPGAILRDSDAGAGKSNTVSAQPGDQARGQSRSVATKPSKGQRHREKRLEASFGELEKLESSTLMSRQPATGRVKESTMSEAAKKVRRTGRQANRSATFTDVVIPDLTEEIVEDQEANELPATSRAQSSLGAPVSAVASRDLPNAAQAAKQAKPRKAKRRGNGKDPGRSVSFADIPEDEAGEIDDGPTDLQRAAKRKRRVAGKRANNRSCSFTDVIIDTGDEVKEDNTELRGQTTQASRVADTAAGAATGSGAAASAKRRAANGRGGNRLRDFGDVPTEDGDEVKDDNTGPRGLASKNAATSSANNKKPKHKHARRTGMGRSRELSVSCLDEVVAGEIHESAEELTFLSRQARELHASDTPSARASRTPRSSGTLRRSSMIFQQAPIPVSRAIVDDIGARDEVVVEPQAPASSTRASRNERSRKQRKRVGHELSISALPEEEVGEIQEKFVDELTKPRDSAPTSSRSAPGTRNTLPRVPGAARRSSVITSTNVPSAQGARMTDSLEPGLGRARAPAEKLRSSKRKDAGHEAVLQKLMGFAGLHRDCYETNSAFTM